MPDRNDLPGSWLATFVALTTVGLATSHAQSPLPAAVTPTGADLFKQQCATCHSLNAHDPPRQGPVLAGVYGRKPGSLAGFHYSPGYAEGRFRLGRASTSIPIWPIPRRSSPAPSCSTNRRTQLFAKPSSLFSRSRNDAKAVRLGGFRPAVALQMT